jgi:hypothetical protein
MHDRSTTLVVLLAALFDNNGRPPRNQADNPVRNSTLRTAGRSRIADARV